jgi:hypothetical protein
MPRREKKEQARGRLRETHMRSTRKVTPLARGTPRGVRAHLWQWYEDIYLLNVGLAAALFLLQVVHLYWMTAHVVAVRLFDVSALRLSPFSQTLVALVDYTEIPAILGVSLVYLHALRKGVTWKPLLLLTLVNVQWLHLFWITDEFFFQFIRFNAWLAWVAILIDYLEVPVMLDILSKFITELLRGRGVGSLRAFARRPAVEPEPVDESLR